MSDLVDAVARMRQWGEKRNWCGYDPYDALNSPAAPALSLGTVLGRRVFTQAVKRTPVNLRPLLGIKPAHNAKAIALVASGYARLWTATGDEEARRRAGNWLDWLVSHPATGADLAWGYHFPVQTRVFSYAANAPNTIATTFAAQALLEGCELLGDNRWEEPAQRAARFLLTQMHVDRASGPYFRYLRGQDDLIHNANALACATVARAGFHEEAERALETTLAAQRPDGSWAYAEGSHDWVDNFHTAYVLDSIARCFAIHHEAYPAAQRGLAFWHERLFLADGTPRYSVNRTYPLDAHCYATAIDTWLALAPCHSEAFDRATRLAGLLVGEFLDERGFVLFQKERYWTNRVAFIRWTTAPAFRALAGLEVARRARQASLAGAVA